MFGRFNKARVLAIALAFASIGGFVGWWATRDPVPVSVIRVTKEAGLSGRMVLASDGMLFAADLRGIFALDSEGRRKWQLSLRDRFGPGGQYPDLKRLAEGSLVTAYMQFQDRRCVVWITNGVVRNEKTIDLAQVPLGGDFATVVSNDVCLATRDGIVLLQPDGAEKWRYPMTSRVVTTPAPALDGGWLFEAAESATNAMIRLNADGTLRWRRQSDPGYGRGPAIREDGSYLWGRGSGLTLAAFDPVGKPLWQLRRAEAGTCTPALGAGGMAYLGVREDGKRTRLLAVDRDGQVRWEAELSEGNLLHSPVIASDGMLYLVTMDRWVRAFDSKGELRWSYRVPWRLDRNLPRGVGEVLKWWRQRMGYIRPVGSGPPLLDDRGRLWVNFSHLGTVYRFETGTPGNGGR